MSTDRARERPAPAGSTQTTLPCPFPMSVEGSEEATTSSQPNSSREESYIPPRCYWALLSFGTESSAPETPRGMLRFVYVDPDIQEQLGSAAPFLIDRPFTDFVHTEERVHAHDDLSRIIQSRTLFGSVTRCRFASIPLLRRVLTGGQLESASPTEFTSTDVVVNMVGDRLALCFFHAVLAPGEQHSMSCGNVNQTFDARQSQQLWHQLCREQEKEPLPLHYVFQVLGRTPQRRILFSWPPPRMGKNDVDPEGYHAEDFARLVQGIHAGQVVNPGQPTSCTQRFRASHSLTTAGRIRGISSVLIPYGSVVLACFQVTSDRPSSEQATPVARRQEVADNKTAEPSDHSHAAGNENDWKSETHATIPLDSANARSALLQRVQRSPDIGTPNGNVATLAAVAAATTQTKTCSSCGKSNSPEWRRGPSGHKTVCVSADSALQCMWAALCTLIVEQAQAGQGRHSGYRRGNWRSQYGPAEPRQWRRLATRCPSAHAKAQHGTRRRSCVP